MAEVNNNVTEYVASLVERARKAQAVAESFTQEQVDELTAAIAYNGTTPQFAKELGYFAAEESELGNGADKIGKMYAKVKGAYRDMKHEKSVGLVDEDKEKGMLKFAKPVGVILGVVPSTNPEATPFVKALNAVKTRNAIILAPHPRTKQTNIMAVSNIRATLKKYGAPEDLVISVEPEMVSIATITELMKQVDYIIATGGSGLVKSAYSSGTPAIGVGVGNATTVIDGSTDLRSVANMVMRSKTFDNATSCSTENNCIVNAEVYDDFVKALEAEGAYFIPEGSEDKEKLKKAMWPGYPDSHALNRDVVAQPAAKIAEVAGIELPEGKVFIAVEESGIGWDYPFSGEKLSIVTTLHQYTDFAEALEKLKGILAYEGSGHSCGIHTTDVERVKELAAVTNASRIMVNQPQSLANSGAWTNGMPMSLTLGCGTWGGNSVSHNVTWKDFLNYTYVSFPIESTQPTDEELFGAKIISENS